MQRDNQLWSLFVTGLQRLQFTDQRDELSYYQIAGKLRKAAIFHLVLMD